jgi:hypothetical protein
MPILKVKMQHKPAKTKHSEDTNNFAIHIRFWNEINTLLVVLIFNTTDQNKQTTENNHTNEFINKTKEFNNFPFISARSLTELLLKDLKYISSNRENMFINHKYFTGIV